MVKLNEVAAQVFLLIEAAADQLNDHHRSLVGRFPNVPGLDEEPSSAFIEVAMLNTGSTSADSPPGCEYKAAPLWLWPGELELIRCPLQCPYCSNPLSSPIAQG